MKKTPQEIEDKKNEVIAQFEVIKHESDLEFMLKKSELLGQLKLLKWLLL